MTLRSIFASFVSAASFATLAAITGCSGADDAQVGADVPTVEGQSTTSAANTTSSGASSTASSSASNSATTAASNANGSGSNHATTGGDDEGAGTGTTMTTTPPVITNAGDCPALTYPSGVVIQTFPDAATTASYANHLASGETAPACFLDADNLINPVSGEVYALTVNVSDSFQLEELVGTEIDQGYGHFVLAVPAAVASLEKFRQSVGEAVDVISGFRSPKHQEDTCNSLCGDPLGCSGTCANNSRHMHGDAFDLPTTFYTSADQTLACTDGFKFSYLESGTHLHVDQNPAYATCVKE